jgi:hypothetical protein
MSEVGLFLLNSMLVRQPKSLKNCLIFHHRKTIFALYRVETSTLTVLIRGCLFRFKPLKINRLNLTWQFV